MMGIRFKNSFHINVCQRYNGEKIRIMEASKAENFANARDIRNLFEKVITKQASRLAFNSTDDIMEIIAEDFN